jgi:hypothetical protein
VIRIREILDPELRQQIVAALAERRGMSAAAIPDWFELDDADYVDLLNDLAAARRGETADDEPLEADDPRM